MPGYDDPRFLQQVIEKLQRDVAALTGKTLPLAAQQRGPTPGYMRAVQINDPNVPSTMWFNLNGSAPGVAPYQAVTDPNGVIRYEAGNLAALGVSPAQYGWRVSGPDAIPFADSIGVLGLPKLLGSSINFSQQTVTGNGAFQTVSGSTVTFTLTRQSNIVVLAAGTCLDPNLGESGFSLSYGVMFDGVFDNTKGPRMFVSADAPAGTPFGVSTLSAGSHNASMGVNQSNTFTWSFIQGFLYVFLFGG